MTQHGRNFTDELRERLSIYDVVSARVPLVKKGNNFWGCCPFHNEKTASFSVNEEKGFYHCFGCGEHGDIISFQMKTGNMDFKSAIAELANMAGLKLPEYKPKSAEQIKTEESYFEITNAAADIYNKKLFEPDGEFALNYILGRGFSVGDINKYKIGYAPKNNLISGTFANKFKQKNMENAGLVRNGEYGPYDFFRDKLMFPITNAKGEIVAFSGRSLDGSNPKYINTVDTEFFHKRKTIFGLSFAKDEIYKKNRSIIVEGQIDAIKMQMSGFGETVAPLGTALTEDHIAILCKINRNITFCFDGDNAGRKAAIRAAEIVMPFVRNNSDIKFVFMPNGTDPDDVLKSPDGVNNMKKFIDSAQPIVDFIWDNANKNFVVSTPGGRNQADNFLKNILEKISDKSLKYEYEQEYKSRKFNQWHKWSKTKNTVNISMPNIDERTLETLSSIIDNYPQIAEEYFDFLSNIKIPNTHSVENILSLEDAKKFVFSFQLKTEMENLQALQKELTLQLLNGDMSVSNQLSDTKTKIDEIEKQQLSLHNN